VLLSVVFSQENVVFNWSNFFALTFIGGNSLIAEVESFAFFPLQYALFLKNNVILQRLFKWIRLWQTLF